MSNSNQGAAGRPVQPKDLAVGLLLALGLGVLSLVLLPFAFTPVGYLWLTALCVLAVRRGTVCGYAGAACITAAAWVLLGPAAAGFTGLIAFGALTAMLLLLRPGRNFTTQLLCGSGAFAALILAAVVVFQALYGSVIDAAADLMRQALTLTPQIQASFEQSLAQLYGESVGIDTLLYSFRESLRLTLPGSVVAYCVFGAGLAVFAARKTAARMGVPETVGLKEDLAKWAMPKYSARVLGGAALVMYLLALFVQSGYMPTATALWRLFQSLFAIHGACLLCYMMRLRGTSAPLRVVLSGLLLLILPLALALTALFERLTPSPRVRGGKILVVQKRRDGDEQEHPEMRELDEEELPEFFRELMKTARKQKDAPGQPQKSEDKPREKPEENKPEEKSEDKDDPEKKP